MIFNKEHEIFNAVKEKYNIRCENIIDRGPYHDGNPTQFGLIYDKFPCKDSNFDLWKLEKMNIGGISVFDVNRNFNPNAEVDGWDVKINKQLLNSELL